MKNHIWISKNTRGDTIEIIVRDDSRTKLESWTIDINDKKRARQIMKHLKKSYGIDFGIKFDEDLDWLKRN